MVASLWLSPLVFILEYSFHLPGSLVREPSKNDGNSSNEPPFTNTQNMLPDLADEDTKGSGNFVMTKINLSVDYDLFFSLGMS